MIYDCKINAVLCNKHYIQTRIWMQRIIQLINYNNGCNDNKYQFNDTDFCNIHFIAIGNNIAQQMPNSLQILSFDKIDYLNLYYVFMRMYVTSKNVNTVKFVFHIVELKKYQFELLIMKTRIMNSSIKLNS